jgi:putative addiction module killer protein
LLPWRKQSGINDDPQDDVCVGFDDHEADRTLDAMYSMGYSITMVEIRESYDFVEFMRDLRDVNAKVRIAQRIRRLALGNPGDVRAVGEGISELRIDYGPGYRVYYKKRGDILIVILCAGDKRSQDSDILQAKQLAKELEKP